MTPAIALSAYGSGLALGASLIIAIGAQNAFVLRQGLKREHVGAVVAVCIACDVVLIALGAVGVGALIAAHPLIAAVAAWVGAAFLFVYGGLAFRSAAKPGRLEPEGAAARGANLGAVVATAFAVSLLNPHVYLDTVVLLGSISAQYAAWPRMWFALGAMTASTAWFSALGFGARALAPVFDRPSAWRVLDVVIGVIMWAIAISLVLGQVH